MGAIGRRAILGAAAGLVAAALRPGLARGRGASRTKLILLGTGGGPRPRKASSAAAQVIIAGGTPYVVDCGDGVARQLVLAGVPLRELRHVFITHHHSDHNADHGNLIWLAWAAGLRTRVDTWGPPPLARMTELFLEINAQDIRTRIADEGRVPPGSAGPRPRTDAGRAGAQGRKPDGHGLARAASSRRTRLRLSVRCARPVHRHLG
jgi:hypothetical protein